MSSNATIWEHGATGSQGERVQPGRPRPADGLVAGSFPAEAPLPTEAEISSRYRVSRQTVRRAFQDLVSEGLVTRIPGKGTFATVPERYLRRLGSVEDLMALSPDSELRVVDPLADAVDPSAAARLAVSHFHPERYTYRTRLRCTV